MITYEARFVSKGYCQRQGIDYDKTLSPIAMLQSIKILLAIVGHCDYEIWKMGVKTTFCNGNLSKDVCMTQMEVFTLGHGNKVCNL